MFRVIDYIIPFYKMCTTLPCSKFCFLLTFLTQFLYLCIIYRHIYFNNISFFPAKDKLFNDLVEELKETGDGFPGSMSDKYVDEQLQIIVNAVWYISGNIPTITERYVHLPADIKPVPQRFAFLRDQHFCGDRGYIDMGFIFSICP